VGAALPEVIEQIPTAELRSLLDEFGTAISALRVSAVEYTMSVIQRAMRPSDGRLRLVVGRVEAIAPKGRSGWPSPSPRRGTRR